MATPRKGTDSTIRQKLTENDSIGQQVAHPLFSRVPLLAEVPTQGFVLANVGGTLYKYTRVGQKLYRMAWTAV